MFGIFFAPVFYDASMFGRYKTLLLLNPISGILEAVNNTVVLHKMPDTFWLSYAGIVSILIFIVGIALFKKTEPLFAENI